ncbi:hypothetical protein BS50DRAFT_487912 [Corynespora cassiicola Philippines]|uniref:Uncharacterized protein n=1 Tax=Corynespora cassiicola Philippines TaxID=1448308 RepID=A0A2T2NYM2_CORCC|nr:hypothetical protein BS50DRAFT_487912 [Corynespora cassiicola Philippines]
MSPAWRIAQPFCLALAPQVNSPEPIWYVGCRVMNGEEKIFYSQTHFDNNYPDLSRWTKTIPNAPRSCNVTFGTNFSYFASAPGHGSIWAGIPTELGDKVQKAFDTPCCVSLGVKDAWFVLWPDGYFAWKFYGHYAALDKILTEAEPRTVTYLAISPYNKEHYFVAFRDRTVKYNFAGAPKDWLAQMQTVFAEWQAEAQQQQQQQQQLYRQSYIHPNGMAPQMQWNQQPPMPMTPGYASPQVPNTPQPMYTNLATPPMSPPAQYGLAPPRQGAVEMAGSTLAAPPVLPRTSSTDVGQP